MIDATLFTPPPEPARHTLLFHVPPKPDLLSVRDLSLWDLGCGDFVWVGRCVVGGGLLATRDGSTWMPARPACNIADAITLAESVAESLAYVASLID